MVVKIIQETEVFEESGAYVKNRLTGRGEVHINYDINNDDESFVTELFELIRKYGKEYFSDQPGLELNIPKI